MRLGWWQRAFPGDPGQLREVRRYVAGLLDGFPARDDVISCAAELASNAIAHTRSGNGGTFVVHVQRASGCLRLAVADAGSDSCPVLRAVSDENLQEGGRGLAIVAALSSRIQIDGDEHGRTVWAEFRWPMGQLPPTSPHDAVLVELGARFSTWVCWYGNQTRQWWAMPRTLAPYLVAASAPEDLAHRIAAIEKSGA
jgi:hypothetical protein